MNKFLKILCLACSILAGCSDVDQNRDTIVFGVSSEYPPFEFSKAGELVGFDIDIAKAVAHTMGKKASFKDMKFASILPALDTGAIQAGISAINITPERSAYFDFTSPYHYFSIAGVMRDDLNLNQPSELREMKLACQIGTNSERWIQKTFPGKEFTAFDGTNQAIEFLKSGRGDVVIVDAEVATGFTQSNQSYKHILLEKSSEGIGIALKKGSELLHEMNKAIATIKTNGQLQSIKTKWQIK
jgi:polar amino acid transport system substrate-binding protein